MSRKKRRKYLSHPEKTAGGLLGGEKKEKATMDKPRKKEEGGQSGYPASREGGPFDFGGSPPRKIAKREGVHLPGLAQGNGKQTSGVQAREEKDAPPPLQRSAEPGTRRGEGGSALCLERREKGKKCVLRGEEEVKKRGTGPDVHYLVDPRKGEASHLEFSTTGGTPSLQYQERGDGGGV